MAGCLRCKLLNNETVVIKNPTLEQIYVAQELYIKYKEELELEGCYNENEILDWMVDNELWDEEKQKLLDLLPKNIEDFKVGLYELNFKTNEKAATRKALAIAKAKLKELAGERGIYTYLSCSGAAMMLRSRFLIAMSIYDLKGNSLYNEDTFWDADDYILNQVVDYYYNTRLSDEQFRELARTEPWRNIWNIRKADSSVFGIPIANLNEEQRMLVTWSSIYDNIYEHPEAPSDAIISDDDVIDGWMIIQRRKRESDAETKQAEDLVKNEKIKGSSEIFIPVDTMEDAKKIDKLNTDHARIVKRKRLALARKRGVIHEAEMPDSMEEIQQELNKQFIENARGK